MVEVLDDAADGDVGEDVPFRPFFEVDGLFGEGDAERVARGVEVHEAELARQREAEALGQVSLEIDGGAQAGTAKGDGEGRAHGGELLARGLVEGASQVLVVRGRPGSLGGLQLVGVVAIVGQASLAAVLANGVE